MVALSAEQVLGVWEASRGLGPVRRALALLAAACPEHEIDRLLDLSVGERDGLLLELRKQLWGPRLSSLATCPACAEHVELAFEVDDIRVAGEDMPAGGETVAVAGREVCFRLPTSRDLLLVADAADLATARRRLLRRCLLLDAGVPDAALDRSVEAAVGAAVARCDPQADVRLALVCPACGHAWEALFDIVSFLWTEIDRWVTRLLHEVHILASAYGWRESDILALSPERRRTYLDLVSR